MNATDVTVTAKASRNLSTAAVTEWLAAYDRLVAAGADVANCSERAMGYRLMLASRVAAEDLHR